MKKIFSNTNKITTCLLLAAVSLASCKKLITIPANPPTAITQQQQFADSATAIQAVAGVYAYNGGNGFAFSDGRVTTSTGLSSDELSYAQTDDTQQFYNYSLTPTTGNIGTLWSNAYQSIYQTNAVLSGVTSNSSLSASFQKQIIGEMEVVRSLYYFYLVNLYGDVPLVTSTDYNTTAYIPRTPVATVYHQIIADLGDARKKLTAAYPSAGRARVNLYAATALLAKVNLYQSNWQSAYNEADSVIKSGLYSVANVPLNSVFLHGSNEAIWQLPITQSFGGVADANFIPYYVGYNPNYQVTKPLLNAFEAGDQRQSSWLGSTVISGKTIYYPYKYKNTTATTTPIEDQMVLRLAEMYLIRAEAAAQLNNLTQALADVNTIRARAGLAASTASTSSQTAVLTAVMKERQTELFCEWGNRWFDLKRTGNAAAVLGTEKTGFTANAALYPLPQAQLQLDNLLKQNPGY